MRSEWPFPSSSFLDHKSTLELLPFSSIFIILARRDISKRAKTKLEPLNKLIAFWLRYTHVRSRTHSQCTHTHTSSPSHPHLHPHIPLSLSLTRVQAYDHVELKTRECWYKPETLWKQLSLDKLISELKAYEKESWALGSFAFFPVKILHSIVLKMGQGLWLSSRFTSLLIWRSWFDSH